MDSTNSNVENQINVTILFPDASLPNSNNAGFTTQEEFRDYVLQKQESGTVSSTVHVRPSSDIVGDYIPNSLVQAFILNFPYGHSGLNDDPVLVKMRQQERMKKQLTRDKIETIQYFLQHSKPEMHLADFVLVCGNIIMKQEVFKNVRIHSSVSSSLEGRRMAERYAGMSAEEFQQAVRNVHHNSGRQYSTISTGLMNTTIGVHTSSILTPGICPKVKPNEKISSIFSSRKTIRWLHVQS